MLSHLLLVGKRITIEAHGKREVEQTCEKCHTKFFYTLVRSATAVEEAPYFLFQNWAQRRGKRAAGRKLKDALDGDCELVACPKCNWINEKLIALHRESQHKDLGHASWLILGVGLCATLIAGVGESDTDADLSLFIFVIGSIVSVGLSICGFVLRRTLRRRIDPNNTYPQPPILPVGSPRAYLRDGSGKVVAPPEHTKYGFTYSSPTNLNSLDPPEANIGERWVNGWAIILAGVSKLPTRCCECLGPAQCNLKVPFSLNKESILGVPMCRSCQRAIRRQWWKTQVVIASIAIAICWISIALSEDPINSAPIVSLTIVVALTCMALIPTQRCKPYRIRIIDPARGLSKIRFKNEIYTRMVANSHAIT